MEIFGHYQRARLLLLGSMLACFAIFWWVGGAFGIPSHRHLDVSLLASSPGPVSVLVVAVVILLCTLVGTLIAGTIRFDAGLFAACCGLAALSMRGGTMGDLLRQQNGLPDTRPAIFWLLIVELILLFAILGMAWFMLKFLKDRQFILGDAGRDGIEEAGHSLQDRLTALLVQIVVMGVCLYLLLQSDAKKQVMVSVGLSACIGAAAAYYLFPVQPSPWFWSGPLVVGTAAYVLAYFTPLQWQIGIEHQPLACALPLDYASAGPAGALLGYWMARKSQSSGEMVNGE